MPLEKPSNALLPQRQEQSGSPGVHAQPIVWVCAGRIFADFGFADGATGGPAVVPASIGLAIGGSISCGGDGGAGESPDPQAAFIKTAAVTTAREARDRIEPSTLRANRTQIRSGVASTRVASSRVIAERSWTCLSHRAQKRTRSFPCISSHDAVQGSRT